MQRAIPNRELSVRLKMLDRDHREILSIIQELCGSNAQQCDRARLVSLLRQLERVSKSHFTLEESMMKATQFPEQSLHRMRHEWMLEEISRTLSDWKHPSCDAPEQNAAMLLGSHNSHVRHEDLRFGVWLDGESVTTG